MTPNYIITITAQDNRTAYLVFLDLIKTAHVRASKSAIKELDRVIPRIGIDMDLPSGFMHSYSTVNGK